MPRNRPASSTTGNSAWLASSIRLKRVRLEEERVSASLAAAFASSPPSRHSAWADLMRRAFDLDVRACPRCGGRLRLIASVEDPERFAQSWRRSRCRESVQIGAAGRGTPATGLRSAPERHPGAEDAEACSLAPGALLHPGQSAPDTSRDPLTGPLSALYLEQAAARTLR